MLRTFLGLLFLLPPSLAFAKGGAAVPVGTVRLASSTPQEIAVYWNGKVTTSSRFSVSETASTLAFGDPGYPDNQVSFVLKDGAIQATASSITFTAEPCSDEPACVVVAFEPIRVTAELDQPSLQVSFINKIIARSESYLMLNGMRASIIPIVPLEDAHPVTRDCPFRARSTASGVSIEVLANKGFCEATATGVRLRAATARPVSSFRGERWTLAWDGEQTTAAGIDGDGYAFDGKRATYAFLPTPQFVKPTAASSASGTWSLWVSRSSDAGTLLGTTKSQGPVNTPTLTIEGGRVGFRFAGYDCTGSCATPIDTGWHHVMIAWRYNHLANLKGGFSVSQYVDGCQTATATTAATVPESTKLLAQGYLGSVKAPLFVGAIDNVELYSVPLSAADAAELCVRGNPKQCACKPK